MLVGGIGGWLTAVGGAWKDAPVEGFSGWKFLRSPVVATAWTIMLLPFTHDWVALTFAAAGLSVLSIETYKTFFTGGRPPGKFDGKPMRLGVEVQRHWCQLLHSGVYVVPGIDRRADGAVRRGGPTDCGRGVAGGAQSGRSHDLGPRRAQWFRTGTRRTA